MTPAQKLGMEVGKVYRVINNPSRGFVFDGGEIMRGALVRFYWDDGSEHPYFKLCDLEPRSNLSFVMALEDADSNGFPQVGSDEVLDPVYSMSLDELIAERERVRETERNLTKLIKEQRALIARERKRKRDTKTKKREVSIFGAM